MDDREFKRFLLGLILIWGLALVLLASCTDTFQLMYQEWAGRL